MFKKATVLFLSALILLSTTGCKESDTKNKKAEDLVTVYLLETEDHQQVSSLTRYTYHYDDNGYITRYIVEDDGEERTNETYEYTLDDTGRILEKTTYSQSENGNAVFLSVNKYKYDSSSNLIETMMDCKGDEFDSVTTYQYDDHSRMTCRSTSGFSSGQAQFTYDDLGHLVETVHSNNGKISSQYVFKNDAYGNPIEVKYYDADGTLNTYNYCSNKYTYDSQGLKAKRTFHYPYRSIWNDGDIFYHYKEMRLDKELAKNLAQVYGDHIVIIRE